MRSLTSCSFLIRSSSASSLSSSCSYALSNSAATNFSCIAACIYNNYLVFSWLIAESNYKLIFSKSFFSLSMKSLLTAFSFLFFLICIYRYLFWSSIARVCCSFSIFSSLLRCSAISFSKTCCYNSNSLIFRALSAAISFLKASNS